MWTTVGLAKGPWMEPGCSWTIFWLMLVLVLTLFGMTNWYQLAWIIVVYIAFFAGAVCGHLQGTEDWIWKIGCPFWTWMEARVCSKIHCGKCWMEIHQFHAKCWNTVFLKVESNKVFMVRKLSHSNHPHCSGTSATAGAKVLILSGGRNCPSTSKNSIDKNFALGNPRNCRHAYAILHRGRCCGACSARLAMKLQINLMSMTLQKCWSICSMVTLLPPWLCLHWPNRRGQWQSWNMLYPAWRAKRAVMIWDLLLNFWNIRRMIFWTPCCL